MSLLYKQKHNFKGRNLNRNASCGQGLSALPPPKESKRPAITACLWSPRVQVDGLDLANLLLPLVPWILREWHKHSGTLEKIFRQPKAQGCHLKKDGSHGWYVSCDLASLGSSHFSKSVHQASHESWECLCIHPTNSFAAYASQNQYLLLVTEPQLLCSLVVETPPQDSSSCLTHPWAPAPSPAQDQPHHQHPEIAVG